MVAAHSSQPDEPPYPSFEKLRSNKERVLFSPAAKRLYWPLEGVFPSAISVMRTARSVGELEPFFRPDTSHSGSGIWHEISTLPLTDPKVSSVEASLRDLDQWESDWLAWHSDHTAPEFDAEYITYGDLGDEDRPYATEPNEDGSWEEDSDAEFLIRCCGDDRPLRKIGLKIKVAPSSGNNFVTVHDYVSGKPCSYDFKVSPLALLRIFLTISLSRASMAHGLTWGYHASKGCCTSWALC